MYKYGVTREQVCQEKKKTKDNSHKHICAYIIQCMEWPSQFIGSRVAGRDTLTEYADYIGVDKITKQYLNVNCLKRSKAVLSKLFARKEKSVDETIADYNPILLFLAKVCFQV